jgi:sigma-54 dependent transcriptional regulator, acetoin dehydrogenase operon transcriptional activator AcoR
MIISNERRMAHARAVQARGNTVPPEGLPQGLILDSWVRCMEAGLDPGASPHVPVVEAADLARRREGAQFVRGLAQAQLETLSQTSTASSSTSTPTTASR